LRALWRIRFRLNRRVARIGSTSSFSAERETMNTQEAKLVLEAALLTAEQPLSALRDAAHVR